MPTDQTARLSYRDHAEGLDDLIERIKAKRGGNLPNLFKLLLHSPAVAEQWFAFMSATRGETCLDGNVRELTILLVANRMRAEYPVNDHIPIALAEGMAQEKIDAVPNWRKSELFDDREKALLEYVETMTDAIQVPNDVFANAKAHFNEREIVEITVLVGAYNMVARFLEALTVDLEPS